MVPAHLRTVPVPNNGFSTMPLTLKLPVSLKCDTCGKLAQGHATCGVEPSSDPMTSHFRAPYTIAFLTIEDNTLSPESKKWYLNGSYLFCSFECETKK